MAEPETIRVTVDVPMDAYESLLEEPDYGSDGVYRQIVREAVRDHEAAGRPEYVLKGPKPAWRGEHGRMEND